MSDLDYILHGGVSRKQASRKRTKRQRPEETNEASTRAVEFYRRLRDAGMSVVDARRIALDGRGWRQNERGEWS